MFTSAYCVMAIAEFRGHLHAMNRYIGRPKNSVDVCVFNAEQAAGGSSFAQQFPRSWRITHAGTGDGTSQQQTAPTSQAKRGRCFARCYRVSRVQGNFSRIVET